MIDWWQGLDGAGRLFWSIAIGATVFQVLLFLSALFGSGDLDHSTDTEFDSTQGIKLLSIRAIVAFLVGFGWAGGLMLNRGMDLFPALGIAMVTGFVFMTAIFLIMRGMMSLRADGTMNFHNAVGGTGSVYVTIPANRGGHGHVEIEIQGRITTIQAVTNHGEPLAPQSAITVDAVEPGNVLVVSPRF